MICIVK